MNWLARLIDDHFETLVVIFGIAFFSLLTLFFFWKKIPEGVAWSAPISSGFVGALTMKLNSQRQAAIAARAQTGTVNAQN